MKILNKVFCNCKVFCTSCKRIIVCEALFVRMQLPYAAVLLRSAQKLCIKFPYIMFPTPRKQRIPRVPLPLQTQAKHTRMLMQAWNTRILLSKVYLSTDVDHDRGIPSILLSNILVVYFHASTSAEVPRIYLLTRKLAYICKACRNKTVLQICAHVC